MIGSHRTICSPSNVSRRRSTPWVAGCCGPMFRTMSVVANSPAPAPTPTVVWRVMLRVCHREGARSLRQVDQVFAPPGEAWQRVSPQLARMRRLLLLGWMGVSTVVVAGFGQWLLGWWFAALAVAAGVVVIIWGLWLIRRNWQAWGYAEREDDLLVTHGVMFRKLTVVPYGRMQFVDVRSGPLERRLPLATAHLHTPCPASDARIPGLPPDEAARLRDRLAALGEARGAGLWTGLTRGSAPAGRQTGPGPPGRR